MNTEFQDIQDNELDSHITEQEIHRAVFKQKNSKSSGPDELSAEIIKASYDIISPHIISILTDYLIIQNILKAGVSDTSSLYLKEAIQN